MTINTRSQAACPSNGADCVIGAIARRLSSPTTRAFSGLALFLFFSPWILQASRPARWITTTQEDFLGGEFTGVAVSSEGRLTRAPALQLVLDTRQAYIHSALADRSGVVYVGTGSDGKVYRIPVTGEASEFADLKESGVFALAVDTSNRLYAATSPEGEVYRFDAQGKAQVFSSPREKYLWDLAIDTQNNVYVATGPKGIIYKIDPSGNSTTFFDSDQIHVVRLAFDINGNLLAGTAPGGQLLRFSEEGNASVLLDSDLEEVNGIASDRYGNVYATALSFEAAPEKADANTARPRALTISPATKTEDSETVAVEGIRRGKKLELYRVSQQGLVETLYSEDASMAFDLLVRPDLTVLLSTSDRGRIISIDPNGFLKLLAQSPDDQVTRLVQAGNSVYAMTSNLGKVYRLGGTGSDPGSYQSKVLDAKVLTRWGRVHWKLTGTGGQAPNLFSRSGNTSKPDSTWSDWTDAYSKIEGDNIKSPAARFLQWKAEFPVEATPVSAAGIALDSVSISYLQENVAPRIAKLTVHPAGSGFIKQPSALAPGSGALGGPDRAHALSLPSEIRKLEGQAVSIPPRRVYIPGARSVSWEASDVNEDDLRFAIHFRAEDESEWKALVKQTSDTHYTLDGSSLADGIYLFRITASDLSGNPPDLARESSLISRPFLISNTLPIVELGSPTVSATAATLPFQGKTKASSVFQAEYSVNAGEWRIIYPTDGIADGREESFEIQLTDLIRGEHSVTIRVIDTGGNIGTGRVTFRVQ